MKRKKGPAATSLPSPKRLNSEAVACGDALFDPPELQLYRFTMHTVPDYDTFGGLSIGIKVFTAASQGNPSRLLFNSAWHGVQPRRKKSASHKVTFCPDSLLVKGDVQVRGYQREIRNLKLKVRFSLMFTLHVPPCTHAAMPARDVCAEEAERNQRGGGTERNQR